MNPSVGRVSDPAEGERIGGLGFCLGFFTLGWVEDPAYGRTFDSCTTSERREAF